MPKAGRTQPLRRGSATSSRRIAVIVSRYNATVTDRLRDGAVEVISERLGADAAEVLPAPGSYELPVLAMAAAQSGRYDGVVALGCLIRGDTRHDRYIADAVAHGLMNVTLITGIPAAFGVITAETPGQARDRAGGKKGNKGQEAAAALLDTLETIDAIRDGVGGVGRGGGILDSGAATSKPDKARGQGRRDRSKKAKQK